MAWFMHNPWARRAISASAITGGMLTAGGIGGQPSFYQFTERLGLAVLGVARAKDECDAMALCSSRKRLECAPRWAPRR